VATAVSGWYIGELQKQLKERLRYLDPVTFEVARDFIEGWKALIGEWRDTGFPEENYWHAHVANNPEGAALLGVAVDLREHRPYTEVACLAPCVIYDKESVSEEEPGEQPLQDPSSSGGKGCEELLQDSVGRRREGGGPSKGGIGEAIAEEQQRARDKGKAKVQDTGAGGGWTRLSRLGVIRKRGRGKSGRSGKSKSSSGEIS
jgi:hypothetical protein